MPLVPHRPPGASVVSVWRNQPGQDCEGGQEWPEDMESGSSNSPIMNTCGDPGAGSLEEKSKRLFPYAEDPLPRV